MGWGESAGFAEQLSYRLGRPHRRHPAQQRRLPGPRATCSRRELARGHDRLAGKKLVVWEFAARELSIGNWKLLPFKLGAAAGFVTFFNPNPGDSQSRITGTVQSGLVRCRCPGSVPYKDHILTRTPDRPRCPKGSAEGASKKAVAGALQALVYLWSMRDNVWTPAARDCGPGDQITVRLRAWSEVAGEYEKINRSELDDPEALQLEEPVWGDWVR